MQTRQFFLLAGGLAVFSLLPASAQTPAPVMQLPRDQAAFKTARNTVDPEQRIKALQDFIQDFPDSKRVATAREALLNMLLERPARDLKQIHEVAQAMVDTADKEDRAAMENTVAYDLAEASPDGVDLTAAEAWARDGVKTTTIVAVTSQIRASSAEYKYPMPPLKDIQQIWAKEAAGNMQTLVDVLFHEGKIDEASAELDKAYALDPAEGYIFTSRGQIAHARHQDAQAVEDLETAVVYGGITPPSQQLLKDLYAARHNGDVSGLDAEIDKRYENFPKPFTVTPRSKPPTGRTVLVELHTGSACAPCVAADLGLDGILAAYPRDEVVALSFDQHVPQPDPLANPDSVARADYQEINGTPTVRIDGEVAEVGFGDRTRAPGVYQALGKAVDAELDTSSSVSLRLAVSLTPSNAIAASANVTVSHPDALKKVLTVRPTTGKTVSANGAKPAADAPKLVLNFALVQKEVRYSGENGIRYHSMVVRSLAKPSTEGFPVALTGASDAAFTFDPATVSDGLSKYLTEFSQHNERFGTAHFLMTDTHLPLDELAVAAWVEDTKTHRVVAASYAPVSAPIAGERR